jgi:hypothetical protein
MIAKPHERLTNGPAFSELQEHESNGFADTLIGVQYNLARRIEDIPDRQALKHLTTTRFRFLACLHPLPKNLQFNHA